MQYGARRPVVCEELKIHKEHIGQYLRIGVKKIPGNRRTANFVVVA
jgi:hypothetical protein